MKKIDKTKFILVIVIIVLLFTNLIFIIMWNLCSSKRSGFDYVNESFDSLYNANNGFRNDIEFLKSTVLYKINRTDEMLRKNNLSNEGDLVSFKNLMDSLRVSLTEDEIDLNKAILKNDKSGDTLVFFKKAWVDRMKNTTLSEGKEPFILILDSLEENVREIK